MEFEVPYVTTLPLTEPIWTVIKTEVFISAKVSLHIQDFPREEYWRRMSIPKAQPFYALLD